MKKKKKWFYITKMIMSQLFTKRTLKQNNSLHKGFDNLGNILNDSGLDMRKVLKAEIAIPWTKKSIKEFMFNPIAAIMFEKTSSQLTTKELQKVWEVMIRFVGEKHGVTVPFPCEENKNEKNN